jgi:hypothetical protein
MQGGYASMQMLMHEKQLWSNTFNGTCVYILYVFGAAQRPHVEPLAGMAIDV